MASRYWYVYLPSTALVVYRYTCSTRKYRCVAHNTLSLSSKLCYSHTALGHTSTMTST